MSLLGNDIPVLPVTTCATWYTCQSLNKSLTTLQAKKTIMIFSNHVYIAVGN